MAHFDAVLPGRVHRVIYEDLVDDTEQRGAPLLDYCGLPFEEACLRFLRERPGGAHGQFRTGAPADLPGGVDQWRHFEPWLGPLKAALGPALADYRA